MVLPQVSVNYAAVLIAAVASMIIGAIWYSPAVFGKIWMKGAHMSGSDIKKAKKQGMGKLYLIAFIGSLLFAYVLAHFVSYVNAATNADALELALWTWLGFVVPLLLGNTLWKGESWGAYLVNIVYQLVSISVMAVILTYWI
ncbi:MAG: DUF1761 domain-containing protein [Nanoarchaeota archaeon]